MRMSFHGGMCCGIKHIFELGQSPDEMCEDLPQILRNNADISYNYTDQGDRVFTGTGITAPIETKLSRLDRYLDYLKEFRPSGIVEITIVTDGVAYFSQKEWIPVLKKRKFKEVTPKGGVYNSNSGNYVRVFHLYMGG